MNLSFSQFVAVTQRSMQGTFSICCTRPILKLTCRGTGMSSFVYIFMMKRPFVLATFLSRIRSVQLFISLRKLPATWSCLVTFHMCFLSSTSSVKLAGLPFICECVYILTEFSNLLIGWFPCRYWIVVGLFIWDNTCRLRLRSE